MLEVAKIYRVWLEVEGQLIDACARKGTARLRQQEEIITMMFAPNPNVPELDAIALGRKFSVVEGKLEAAILEATPKGRTAKLKHVGKRQGWTNESQNPDTTKALAYYVIPDSEKNEGRGLEIVEANEIYGDNQIAILENGAIQVSQNVVGKQVKVRMAVKFPKSVDLSEEPITDITVRVVAKWKDDSAKLITLPNCEIFRAETVIISDSAGKPLRLKYDPELIEVVDVG